jgi:hypothetical protein
MTDNPTYTIIRDYSTSERKNKHPLEEYIKFVLISTVGHYKLSSHPSLILRVYFNEPSYWTLHLAERVRKWSQ